MSNKENNTVISEDRIEDPKGAFYQSLARNNSQIKKDRAQTISENAETMYRRSIEDLAMKKKQIIRDRENMLDMSPDNVTTLKVASDFDASAFVQKDIEMGIKIREINIQLEIAIERYTHLFGMDINLR